MEVGKKSQGQNKAPFRCGIENIKVTESFCTQPCRAKYYMNEREAAVPHTAGRTIHRDPARGKDLLLTTSTPSQLESLPDGTVPSILSNFTEKFEFYLEFC